MTKEFIYKVEDIFQDIPGDSENVNFTIPPEIMEAQGWKEGDNLKISWGDQGTVIIEKVEEAPEST
jgi:bifunctional DNA-binding transcriptional regulator/antitoxin component of YhaV-PrlF toxin-antitoxin module